MPSQRHSLWPVRRAIDIRTGIGGKWGTRKASGTVKDFLLELLVREFIAHNTVAIHRAIVGSIQCLCIRRRMFHCPCTRRQNRIKRFVLFLHVVIGHTAKEYYITDLSAPLPLPSTRSMCRQYAHMYLALISMLNPTARLAFSERQPGLNFPVSRVVLNELSASLLACLESTALGTMYSFGGPSVASSPVSLPQSIAVTLRTRTGHHGGIFAQAIS